MQREKLDAADVYADVFTCSSLLGVRRQTSEDEEFFYKDSQIEAKVHDYGLVIIDEISTINRSLWGWIKEAADAGRFFMKPRFVLMGDEAQLPPVKECESEAFRIQCPSAQLTQIMRHDGPITAYVTTIRSVLESRPPHAVQIVRDGRGIWVTEDDDLWFKRMKSGFTSAGYADDPSYCRAIAWTNARVNYLNSKIRAFLGRRGEWEVGERIMANAPYGLDPEDGPVLHNSEEATVQYVKEGASQGWPVWWLSLLKDNDQTEIIPVLQKTAEREFKKELDTLRRQSRWQSFWALKESMADISYGYAMTSHKAQGSTFQNVWADMRNLRRNPKVNTTTEGRRIPEVTQLAYVAATRAAQRLFILE